MAYTSGAHTMAIGGITRTCWFGENDSLGSGVRYRRSGATQRYTGRWLQGFGAVDLRCMPFDDTKVDNVGSVYVGLGEGPGVGAAGRRCGG